MWFLLLMFWNKAFSYFPNRMAPIELKKLKRQLLDLLSKGVIIPCVSFSVTAVLFLKKKYGSMGICIHCR